MNSILTPDIIEMINVGQRFIERLSSRVPLEADIAASLRLARVPPWLRDAVSQAWEQGKRVDIEERYQGTTVYIEGGIAVTEIESHRIGCRRLPINKCHSFLK